MIKKSFILAFLVVCFLFTLSQTVLAKPVINPSPTPQPTPTPTEQSSYVLFYPVTAGKIEGESMYAFKLFRDKLIEILTFGNERKAEANLKIATKRLLEVERLFKEGKTDLAENTVSKYNTKLAASYDYTIASQESDDFPNLLDQISQTSLKHLIVLKQLLAISPDNQKELLQDAIARTTDIQNKANQTLKGE